ncbi:carbohydrate binding domain-containing protein [Agarivorans sp. Alg241-V36]|uniref:carbohydrate binding domain-containing protein n=1 Tax=Agarivorans sp. Alg241-V36 TaxID=2305992 RepID=UPI0013D0414D|nr:carbohydrate binding domain-containing protein [Agarivorans sp. Alg241-V36]
MKKLSLWGFAVWSVVIAFANTATAATAGNRYMGGVPIQIAENVNFNFNIASQGNRNATVWYTNNIAIAVEGRNTSNYDRATMEQVVGLMEAVKGSFEEFTGVTNLPLNGGYQNIPTIQVPADNNGSGGLAGHGYFGLSVGRAMFDDFYNRIRSGNISIDQVWLYEMNRNYFLSRWNDHIDWAMSGDSSNWGWWTVGFNNASVIWILEDLGIELNYFGQNLNQFRNGMLNNYTTYVGNTNYTFDNAWTVHLMPWNQRGSVNDLMTGSLITWYEQFGGKPFIQRLYREIFNTPKLNGRFDYPGARDNWYRLVSRAAGEDKASYFENTLRWQLSQGAKNEIYDELGDPGNGGGTDPGNGGGTDPGNGGGETPVGNVVSNPSFENGISPWFGQYDSSVSRYSQGAEGNYSIRSHNRPYYYSGPAITLTSELKAGEQYNVSGLVKLAGSGSDKARLLLGIEDQNGFRFEYIGSNGTMNSSSWTEYGGVLDLRNSSYIKSAYLMFYGPAAGREFYLDNVSVVDVNYDGGETDPTDPIIPTDPPTDPVEEIIQNGDFELANTTGWNGYQGSSVKLSDTAYSGNYALQSFNRTEWFHGPHQVLNGKLTAGKRYNLSAQLRMLTRSDNIDARILYRDGSGWHWQTLGSISASTSSWNELNVEFAFSPTGTVSTIELFFFGPQAGREFLVDTVVLTEQ